MSRKAPSSMSTMTPSSPAPSIKGAPSSVTPSATGAPPPSPPSPFSSLSVSPVTIFKARLASSFLLLVAEPSNKRVCNLTRLATRESLTSWCFVFTKLQGWSLSAVGTLHSESISADNVTVPAFEPILGTMILMVLPGIALAGTGTFAVRPPLILNSTRVPGTAPGGTTTNTGSLGPFLSSALVTVLPSASMSSRIVNHTSPCIWW
mmetsp:Transcript_54092/g.108815  ORF Transcript_54092/g.108815 Transcript_54092/m.108815 type:complete len:206 (+) Transcript_54092:1030-1647(+)